MNRTLENHYYEDFIMNIPWERNPMLHVNDNIGAYIAAVNLIMGGKPIEQSVDYNSDVWDFNRTYSVKTNTPSEVIKLSLVPEELRDYARFFIIHKISGPKPKKISTIGLRLTNAMSVIAAVMQKTRHKSIGVIDLDDLVAEIQSRDVSSSHIHTMYESLYQFYYFLEENCHRSLPVNLNTLKRLGIEAKRQSKKTQEEDKLPDIPKEYFNKILRTCLAVMRDKKQPKRDRAMAASVVMLSQLGVRIGDLLNITTDSLFSQEADGHVMHFINYSVEKLSKPHAPQVRFDIYASEVCVEAFNILLKLRKFCPESRQCNYLVMLPVNPRYPQKLTYPVSKTSFRENFKKFCVRHLPVECHYPWPGIEPSVVSVFDKVEKKMVNDTVYVPVGGQFRVRLCTYLYEHGVKLSFIEQHLAHLSEMMYGYYARPKDTRQENAENAERFIKNIVLDEMTPIGLHSEELMTNLHSFIEKRKLNVHTDMKEIMARLDSEVSIRAKTGGFCFRTSLLPCPEDPHTNKLLCAFNRCPNVYSFFYMADLTFSRFAACKDAYYANLQRGLKNAAHKELINAQDIINRSLSPQIFQLEKELDRHGKDAILKKYPQLTDIVNNIETIKQEMRIWKMKQ